MGSLDLEQKYIQSILGILLKYLDKDRLKVYAFGSRTKGTSWQNSDLDLAVDYRKEKLDDSVKVKIEKEFEDSSIPFFIDFIDLNNIKDDFKSVIFESLIEININS